MPEQSEHHQQKEKMLWKMMNENRKEIRKENESMLNKRLMKDERPVFPKRAVITAGMPYGNKNLHFGHVGGMFVHADIFARFLRDRIGKENVIFVSGTDCYGSPILESYRKLKESGYEGTMEQYVTSNHESQKKTLSEYGISLDFFGASALGEAGETHKKVSAEVFHILYRNGYMKKMAVPQFYDEELGVFLNGRQVIGKCPIPGCTSDKSYADECSLGHQFLPSELVNPISSLSGKKPVLKEVENWYFDLDSCIDWMKEYHNFLKRNTNTRKYQLETIDEFLKKPMIYVPRKYVEDITEIAKRLPEHKVLDEEKKNSITFEFENLNDRDKAKEILEVLGIHYTSGKTLVPFRLSGNVEWGVPFPECEELKGLTFWVWPESLWAPISFTRAYLKKMGKEDEVAKWWDDDEALVYQFIGEDNIYFYAIAQTGLFTGLRTPKAEKPDMEKQHMSHIIANRHLLYMDTKASSSSEIKLPMADELLAFYTKDQLRMHFMSLGLSSKSVGFKPQAFMAKEEQMGVDMVLKEGNLLTNVFNRLIRSCFYACKIMAILVHPIAPEGCEMFREYMNIGEELWNWDYILEPISFYTDDLSGHELKVLEPRVDFFKKHACQICEG